MFYKSLGERENLRKMKVTDFVLKIHKQRKRYFQNVAQHETTTTKKHPKNKNKKNHTDEVKRTMRM